MAETAIEWTNKTWNPVAGCTRASEGCDHCYAATMTRRLEAMGQADYAGLTTAKHFNGVVRTLPHKLDQPLKWRKPRMVFVNSMSDLFHKDVPFEFIDAVFGLMAACPQHTFQVLTKRADRMAEWCVRIKSLGGIGAYIRSTSGRDLLRGIFGAVQLTEVVNGKTVRANTDPWMQVMNGAACNMGPGPLSNVWLGVSVENENAEWRIHELAKCDAAVRFVSAEPLIGPLNEMPGLGIEADRDGTWRRESKFGGATRWLDWVIVGGESGPGARPCNVAWIRSIRDQCAAAGVACFVKQLGARPHPQDVDLWGRFIPDGERRYLDTTEHLQIKDKRGGEISEWPEDLRVRQWPTP